MDKVKKILIISSDSKLLDILGFCFDGWGYEVSLWSSYDQDITAIKKVSPDVIVIDIHSAKQTDLVICNIIKDDFVTAFIPVITLINKRHLRGQLLSLKHGVDDYLIKPPDPLDLRIRIEMAIKRAQYSYYASPLTGIPGGRIIEEVLGIRIKNQDNFSFGYLDIDNFKYFNDVYGYQRGDRVIMQTAYMLYSTIKNSGNRDDFIGHIGGDDFVFITTPDKYEEICKFFISAFDRVIPFHYFLKDRKRRFIVARDRSHKLKKLPLMSVSVAIVNKRKKSDIKSIIDINERVAEIKKYLKGMEGSKFMVDRRSDSQNIPLTPLIYEKGKDVYEYKPLGQILVEKHILSSDQLDEALKLHWRRGIILGEILKELGFLKEEQLKEALGSQEALASD